MSITPGLTNSIVGAVTVTGTVVANPTSYTTQYDDAGSSITYIGKALPGTATSSAGWQISQLNEASTPDFTLKYADGTAAFTKVWDSRASYSYS